MQEHEVRVESESINASPHVEKLQLHGGDTLNNKSSSSSKDGNVKPQPGETTKQKSSRNYLSFRRNKKKQMSIASKVEPAINNNTTTSCSSSCSNTNAAATTTSSKLSEKGAIQRRISFKTVALSIQKWLIRVSVPRQSTTTSTTVSSFDAKQESASNDSNKKLNPAAGKPVAAESSSTPKPNWNSVFSGIQNHGNTCFLNAVIQCLSHTDLLAKYIVLDAYKSDLRARNSITKKSEVTERLAVLIKSLWTSRYSAEISSGFKTVVGKHGQQYRGTLQHDAQEFLLWLLDAVHEDVNRAQKRKALKSSVVHSGNKMIDYSAILNYISNNQSFILDVFQAVLRSSLTCPQCGKQSVTFDPYLSLSLPIPQRTTCPVWLTYIRPTTQRRHTRLAVNIALRYRVVDLLHEVARMMNIPMETLVLTEMYSEGFRRTFSGNESVSSIQNVQNLYIFELSGFNHFEKPTLLMQSLFPRLPNVAILVINCEIQTNGCLKRFGTPYSVRVLKELSYIHLQEAIFKANTNVKCDQDGNAFGLRVYTTGHFGTGCHLTPEVDHPLYQGVIEESLKSSTDKAGPCHVKLIAEWSKESRERYFDFDPNEKLYEMHPSVSEVDKLYADPWSVTIDECLNLYTQEEQLSGDAWLCPNCHHEQQGAKKQLHLHTVPDVLIIHLKRFKQLKTSRSKLHTMVHFPVGSLDMSPYMDMQQPFKDDPPALARSRSGGMHMYDLYAVCNHLGTMCVGHYTATCKNPVDGHWYSYDDSRVDRIPEQEIVSNSAYLLFYVRRNSSTGHSAMVDSARVTATDASPDHWVFNVPKESLTTSQVSVNDREDINKNEVKEVLSTLPNLAEHYVAKKFQSDTYYTSTSDVRPRPQEFPAGCRVISESCV